MEKHEMEKAKKQDSKEGADASQANQVRVNWDSSRMKTSYANVCNVSSTREEITVLFGTNQTWQAGQKELAIELSDRVIMSPFAAKRLSIVLKAVIDQYEQRFGTLQVEDGSR